MNDIEKLQSMPTSANIAADIKSILTEARSITRNLATDSHIPTCIICGYSIRHTQTRKNSTHCV